MLFTIEFIITFMVAFGLNLIPFFGPSNLLIASTAAIGMANADATALVTIGFLVALAAALAKGIHYMITFFVSGHLSEKRRQRLDADGAKVKRWAFLLLYINIIKITDKKLKIFLNKILQIKILGLKNVLKL